MSRKGSTLIETLIYIALFSLILTSGFVVAFELVDASDHLNSRKVAVEEANFVVKKINWVVSGAEAVSVSGGDTLHVTQYDSDTFTVALSSGEIALNGTPLTTENVEINNLEFIEITGPPAGITAVLEINGITSSTTNYIRQ